MKNICTKILYEVFQTYQHFRYQKVTLNNKEEIENYFNVTLDDIWTEFLYLQNTYPFPVMRCAAVRIPSPKGNMTSGNMLLTMNVNNFKFGQLVLEFRQNGEFLMNSATDLKNSKILSVPKDSE